MTRAASVKEARTILRLAWPVALTSFNWTVHQIVDVIVVGAAGTHEIAGFGASRVITFVAVMVAIGGLSGVLVATSRADGANDHAGTGAVLHQGWLLAALFGMSGCLPLVLVPGPILLAVGVAPGVEDIAARVVRIMGFAFPAQMIAIVTANWLEGISRPRRVLMVNLVTLPLNALLAWALAGGHFGLPRMGAAGAALATAIVVWGGAAAMVYAAATVPDADRRAVRRFHRNSARAALAGAVPLAKFGAVPALGSGLELAGFAWLIALSTQLGDATAHAFQIVFSIHNLTFGLALGLGSAAGVRAGNAVGEGRRSEARGRTLIAAGLAGLLLGAIALVLLARGELAVAVFPASAEATRIAVAMLAIWAPFIIGDGLQVVFMFALRSLGDQVAAGVNGIVAFFVVTGLLGWALVTAGWGASALVWASGLGMAVAAVLNGARFLWLTSRAPPKS